MVTLCFLSSTWEYTFYTIFIKLSLILGNMRNSGYRISENSRKISRFVLCIGLSTLVQYSGMFLLFIYKGHSSTIETKGK